ncbi:MAG: SCO family protein [Solirubrobacteraceae bacterium]|nr:SCO family protein [Solirubrobacteraceae bacterium]
MGARIRLTVIGFGLMFMLGLTGWLFLGTPGLPTSAAASQDASGYAGAIRPEIPVQPLDGLTDEEGKPAKLGGDVTIVTFLYTNCEDSCPTTAQQIRAAIDDLEDPPPVYAISVDPVGDTRKTAKKFLSDQSLLGRMRYMVGPPVALQRQWKVYGIQPQTREDEHSLSTVILDRTGRQRIGFPLDKMTPEGLAKDIETLRAEPSA